jgi:NADPH-dependent 2,4-dienoyl-CoA reductase/sulfur reductase-like enzyme
MKYVIVGASVAGLTAAESILLEDSSAEIVLLSDENRAPYCRPLISYWLSGETHDSLFPLPTGILDRVDFRPGCRVTGLEPAAKTVRLHTGETLRYDRLLLATGSNSKKIGLPGEDAENIYDFRTWDDAEAIDRAIRAGARRALVIGGGLVGVKAAHALAARGMETLLCVASSAPLSQVVDEEAGHLAAGALTDEGIAVHTGYEPEGLERSGKKVTGVRFTPSGVLEPCDLVVRGKGVSPRTELLQGTAVDARRGIPVDETMRTPLPDVWAAGDAVVCRDKIRGADRNNALWPVAEEQGRVAGLNMAGARESYAGSWARNSVRIGDLHLVSAGIVRPPTEADAEGSEGYEVSGGNLASGGGFRKFVTRDGVLVGFVSVEPRRRGPSTAGLFVAAVAAGQRLSDLPFDPFDPEPDWSRYVWPTLKRSHP